MASAPRSHLVGRDRELGVLRQHLDSALGGQGGLVLIGGEAGIGKTALAEAICHEASQQGAIVLVGRCFDFAVTPVYGPWRYLFERYPPAPHLPPPPTAFAQPGLLGAVPSQAALFREVLTFFEALTAQCPTILLLDDLHWSDPASLDLLRVIAQAVARRALLVLATYRSDELIRQHPLYSLLPVMARETNAERVTLRPLDDAPVRDLVRTRYLLPDAECARLVGYLQELAEGNALFLVELLHSLEEDRILRPDAAGGWQLGELVQTGIPPSLVQVIDRRLARLGEDARGLLTVAAVIGNELAIPLWAAVTDVDEETLLAVAEQAREAALLVPTADGANLGFSHALVRAALYEGIVPPRRQRLHRRIAEVLAAGAQPEPDAVAYHFRQAGDGRAVAWLVRAGKQSHRLWAWPMAKERYEAALALMDATDPGARAALLHQLAVLMMYIDAPQAITYQVEAYQLAVAAQDAALAANLLFAQGELRFYMGDVPRGLAEMAQAVNVLDALTPAEHARLTRLDLIDAGDADGAASVLLLSLAGSGHYAEAQRVAARRRAVASSPPALAGAEPLSGHGHHGLLMTYAALGQPTDAEREYLLARPLLVAEGVPLYVGLNASDALQFIVLPYQSDDLVKRERLATEAEQAFSAASDDDTRLPARRGRLSVLVVEGQWQEARAVAEAVLASSGQGSHITNARHELVPLAYYQGDDARAWQLIREGLPAGVETAPGEVAWYQSALVMQRVAVLLSLDAGDLPAAHAWLAAHDRWLEWSGTVLGQSEGQALWANYYQHVGDRAQATAHAQRALARAREPRQPLALLAAHRLLGELATDAGQVAQAADHLDQALALADACAAPYERALTLLAMAELRAATDERVEALRLLHTVRALCTPLGAQPALRRMEALTARLSAVQPPAPAYPAGLTAREVEVLRLLAAGKSNREIAEALFLSEHTVRAHVRAIFTKTGTDNRAAATAFAFQHALA